MLGTNEECAQLGKLAFVEIGEALEQLAAGYQAENGVAKEFQLLIVGDFLWGALGRKLVRHLTRKRTVRQRLLQQAPLAEGVPQLLFEFSEIFGPLQETSFAVTRYVM